MVDVTWRKYKSWSGCKIRGTKDYELKPDERDEHMKRALWLTAQVEGGGTFGAINSYDGAGMSAGLEHKIALYPRTMQQASLWPLLREMELHGHCEALEVLWEALWCEARWYVAQDGKLRHRDNGRIISGDEIRDMFTPPGGEVPRSGPNWEQAKEWAIMFHNLFAAEETHAVQINSAIDGLISGHERLEAAAYEKTVGSSDLKKLLVGIDIDHENDLAWCVYHSFSVNAPSYARSRLQACDPTSGKTFPKRIIRILGTSNYGRWHDTVDGSNRYDRTRIYAMRSGFWSNELFEGPDAIMPRNL